MATSKVELLYAFYDRVWTHGDLDMVDQFMGSSDRSNGLMNEAVCASDMKTMVEAFLGLIEEPRFTLLHPIEEGDWISALVKIEATSSKNGRTVSISGQVMFKVENGTIVEAYHHYDYIGFFEQMGLIAEDTLPQLLAGAMVA